MPPSSSSGREVVCLLTYNTMGSGTPRQAWLNYHDEATDEATGSDMVTTVNYHRYAKQSSAELIAEGAIS